MGSDQRMSIMMNNQEGSLIPLSREDGGVTPYSEIVMGDWRASSEIEIGSMNNHNDEWSKRVIDPIKWRGGVTPHSEIVVGDWDYSPTPSDLVLPPMFILGSDPPPSICIMKREGGGGSHILNHSERWSTLNFESPLGDHTRSLILREIPLQVKVKFYSFF